MLLNCRSLTGPVDETDIRGWDFIRIKNSDIAGSTQSPCFRRAVFPSSCQRFNATSITKWCALLSRRHADIIFPPKAFWSGDTSALWALSDSAARLNSSLILNQRPDVLYTISLLAQKRVRVSPMAHFRLHGVTFSEVFRSQKKAFRFLELL